MVCNIKSLIVDPCFLFCDLQNWHEDDLGTSLPASLVPRHSRHNYIETQSREIIYAGELY